MQAYLDGDRDLERRRALANEQLAPQDALAADDRATAMRRAGRALALDPEYTFPSIRICPYFCHSGVRRRSLSRLSFPDKESLFSMFMIPLLCLCFYTRIPTLQQRDLRRFRPEIESSDEEYARPRNLASNGDEK